MLSSDVSGLTALKTKVAGETTEAAVRADGKSMVDDYRVYILVAPKVHLTHALDVEGAALARLVKVHDALADRLAKDPAADTAANKALLADMTAQIQAAALGHRRQGRRAAGAAARPGRQGPDRVGEGRRRRRQGRPGRHQEGCRATPRRCGRAEGHQDDLERLNSSRPPLDQ